MTPVSRSEFVPPDSVFLAEDGDMKVYRIPNGLIAIQPSDEAVTVTHWPDLGAFVAAVGNRALAARVTEAWGNDQ
jgi:hypothetical protein